MISRRPPERDDAGFSLMEIVVTMTLLSVLMSLVTAAILQIYHAVNGVDSLSAAQSQVNVSFARLDREVRYARAISDPALVGADYYVEYQLTDDGVDTCVELRLQTSTSKLQRREWANTASTPVPSAWTTLADGITATTPFTVTDPDTQALIGYRYQRLALAFTSTAGGGRSLNAAGARAGAVREIKVAFTALNTTGVDLSTVSATCTQGRGVSS